MKSTLSKFAAALLLVAAPFSEAGSAGCGKETKIKTGKLSQSKKLIVDGINREYFVYLPSFYNTSSSPLPVVVVYHGWSRTGNSNLEETGFMTAAENGFVVLSPSGYADGGSGSWNANGTSSSPGPDGPTCYSGDTGLCYDSCRSRSAGCDTDGCDWTTCVDDIAFTTALLDEAEDDFCVDVTREYIAGFSNGGMMTYTLGVALESRIAAIVPNSGSFPKGFVGTPSGGKMPIMDLHGNSDTTVPSNTTEVG